MATLKISDLSVGDWVEIDHEVYGWRVEITYDAAGILRTTHLMPDIDSVHQLQHALRLAGVDEEINL